MEISAKSKERARKAVVVAKVLTHISVDTLKSMARTGQIYTPGAEETNYSIALHGMEGKDNFDRKMKRLPSDDIDNSLIVGNFGMYGQEVIDVSFQRSKKMQDTYALILRRFDELQSKATSSGKRLDEHKRELLSMEAVAKELSGKFTYSEAGAEMLLIKNIKSYTDRAHQVPLEAFLEEGVAICMQSNLIAGLFAQRLIKDGYVGGKAEVETHFMYNMAGHLWCRYTCAHQEKFIIEVTGGWKKPVPLEKAQRKSRWTWEYRRENEVSTRAKIMRYANSDLAKVVATVAVTLAAEAILQHRPFNAPIEQMKEYIKTPLIYGGLQFIYNNLPLVPAFRYVERLVLRNMFVNQRL